MGRFASAKPSSDNPTILQRALNYLIDLLDKGYSVSATIGGKEIQISINPKDGISITVDGDKVFGIDSTGALYATKLAYVDNPDRFYGVIGDFAGFGTGLALYDADYSADPYFKTCAVYDGGGVFQGTVLYDQDGKPRIGMFGAGGGSGINIFDSSGNYVFNVGDTYVSIEPVTGNAKFQVNNVIGLFASWNAIERMLIDGTESYFRSPDGTNELGVDNTGVYKIIGGGAKTYL